MSSESCSAGAVDLRIVRGGGREQPSQTLAARAEIAASAGRILVAEDDAGVRFCLLTVLRSRGYAVTAVEDGQQAWQALHANDYDLLITDNDMPHLSGLSLVERLRLSCCELPVIVISAYELNAIELEGLSCAAMLQKPFPLSALLSATTAVLNPASANAVVG
jgi:DNA-binding response OmpR family regulator